jgi:hypothetical protein
MTASTSASNPCPRRLSCAAALALLSVHAPITSALEWHIEEVDTLGNAGYENCLVLDGAGYPHISYLCDYPGGYCPEVWYAYRDSSGWHKEMADHSWDGHQILGRSSLALDGSGYPHISYVHHIDNCPTAVDGITYAWKDDSGWHFDGLGEDWTAYFHTSLALDADGYPHVGYGCDRGGIMPYMGVVCSYQDASGWHDELVDSCDPERATPSLALDGEGHPHMSYVRNDTLMYVYRDLSGWQYEPVDGEFSVEPGPTLALDGDGYPHIGYVRVGWGAWYAYKDALGWHLEWAQWPHTVPTSFALDADGNPHFVSTSYFHHPTIPPEWWSSLGYLWKDAEGWQFSIVATYYDTVAYGLAHSLALDAYGVPHISYHRTDSDLVYASPTMVLSGDLEDGQLELNWSKFPWAYTFQVHGEVNQAHFDPTPGSLMAVLQPDTQTWSSPNGVGDPSNNWTYLVLALNPAEEVLGYSNRVGEFDFGTQ